MKNQTRVRSASLAALAGLVGWAAGTTLIHADTLADPAVTGASTPAATASAAAAPAAAAPMTSAPMNSAVGSNTLRLGMYFVFYHATATDIYGPFVPNGVNLNVKNVQTPYFAYVRRLSNKLDLELAFGLPPVVSTVGKGPANLGAVPYNGQVISTARYVAPTVLVNYKFRNDGDVIRPYIGLGVNYTTFIARDSTPLGNAANGGPTRLSLSSSVGPAGTLGIWGRLSDHWNVTASYSMTRTKTHLVANTAGELRTSDISFGPQALVLSAGYTF